MIMGTQNPTNAVGDGASTSRFCKGSRAVEGASPYIVIDIDAHIFFNLSFDKIIVILFSM